MVKKIIPRLKNEERKESIMKTALRLIALNGFDSVSMRSIAKEEKISEVILYRHFRNKSKLLESIIKYYVPIVTESFKEFLETIKLMVTDLTQSLPHISKLYLNRIKEFPYFMMFITKEGDKLPSYLSSMNVISEDFQFEPYGKILYEELKTHEVVTNYFKRCQNDGFLKKNLEPEECTRTVLSLFLPLVIKSPLIPFREPLTEEKFNIILNKQIKIILYAFLPQDKQHLIQ